MRNRLANFVEGGIHSSGPFHPTIRGRAGERTISRGFTCSKEGLGLDGRRQKWEVKNSSIVVKRVRGNPEFALGKTQMKSRGDTGRRREETLLF